MRIALFTMAVVLALPVAAVIGFDRQSINESFFEAPHVANPRLNKRVTFSFNDTKLSDILLVLSRQADFNVILPDKYNAKLTVQINDQKIIDAIDDVMRLNGLNYRFKGNSLLVSGDDAKGQFFVSVPIKYFDAETLTSTLNEILFEQLIIAQDPDHIKPHAFLDPGKNSIIVFGDKYQIEAAKKFIAKQDAPPLVKLYQPVFINLEDVAQIIELYLNKRHSLEVNEYKEASFAIKGQAEEVLALLDLFKRYDHSLEPIRFAIDVYAVKKTMVDFFRAKNQKYRANESHLLNKEDIESEDYSSLYNYTEQIAHEEIELNRDQATKLLGLDFAAERNLFDTLKYQAEFFGEVYKPMTQDLQLLRVIDGLDGYPEIKKLTDINHSKVVLVVMRTM